MQYGTVSQKYNSGRYTHLVMTDGRNVKGKWNPAWHVAVGDRVSWTTSGRWNPNEWFNTVTPLGRYAPDPQEQPQPYRFEEDSTYQAGVVVSGINRTLIRAVVEVVNYSDSKYPVIISSPSFRTRMPIPYGGRRKIYASRAEVLSVKDGAYSLINLLGPNGGLKETVAVYT